jgi:hypothetical protein
VDNVSFHYSRSPVYLRLCTSLVILLCMYNQHARSGSVDCVLVLGFTGFHFSVVGFGTGTISVILSGTFSCSTYVVFVSC